MKQLLLLLFASISIITSTQTVGTKVTSAIVPNDSADNIATHDDFFGAGGYRVIPSIELRNSIYTSRRKAGMLVYVVEDGMFYTLKNGIENTNWQVMDMQYLTINKGLRVAGYQSFPFQVTDTSGYNRFAVSKNGLIVAGRLNDSTVNVDALAVVGARNSATGINSMAIGLRVKTSADSSMVIGIGIPTTNVTTNAVWIGQGASNITFSTKMAIGGPIVNTPSSIYSFAAATGVTSTIITSSVIRIQGLNAAVDITANPQIAAGTEGQLLEIHAEHATYTVKFDTGTGLLLAGGASFTMGLGDVLVLRYVGGVWREISRANN
jgi:hypothetical protein